MKNSKAQEDLEILIQFHLKHLMDSKIPLKGHGDNSKTFHIVFFDDTYIIIESDIYPRNHVLLYKILKDGIIDAVKNRIWEIRNNNHYATDFEKSPVNRKKETDHTSILTKYYRAIHESIIFEYTQNH